MHAITPDAVVIGVDTHKDVHVAVAISGLGARLGTLSIPATLAGYGRLLEWGRAHGPVEAFGIEGTGSYGASLSRALITWDCRVVEVNRPNRQLRRRCGRATRSMPKPPPVPFWRGRPTRLPSRETERSR